jgi:hypothetical protein
MPLTREDRKQLSVLVLVVAGFLCGLALLFFLIATDV